MVEGEVEAEEWWRKLLEIASSQITSKQSNHLPKASIYLPPNLARALTTSNSNETHLQLSPVC